ncbi:hypothetical protein B0H14DRAFT_94379 [Mycena olivaceomarginata]|nr:hypothetical protein B0H14DRAFT_94379 [Mycena olivaceomarginata]
MPPPPPLSGAPLAAPSTPPAPPILPPAILEPPSTPPVSTRYPTVFATPMSPLTPLPETPRPFQSRPNLDGFPRTIGWGAGVADVQQIEGLPAASDASSLFPLISATDLAPLPADDAQAASAVEPPVPSEAIQLRDTAEVSKPAKVPVQSRLPRPSSVMAPPTCTRCLHVQFQRDDQEERWQGFFGAHGPAACARPEQQQQQLNVHVCRAAKNAFNVMMASSARGVAAKGKGKGKEKEKAKAKAAKPVVSSSSSTAPPKPLAVPAASSSTSAVASSSKVLAKAPAPRRRARVKGRRRRKQRRSSRRTSTRRRRSKRRCGRERTQAPPATHPRPASGKRRRADRHPYGCESPRDADYCGTGGRRESPTGSPTVFEPAERAERVERVERAGRR